MAVRTSLLRPLFVSLIAYAAVAAVAASAAMAAAVSDYRPIFRSCRVDGRPGVMIREFRRDGEPSALVVDAATALTKVVPQKALSLTAEPVSGRYPDTLRRYTEGPHRLQNDGITHGAGSSDGIYLTVDLCPSVRSFEQPLFETAAQLSQGKPAPVAVAITGKWLERHPRELEWLLARQAAGDLAITWVNHSDNHPYQPGVPFDKTFLLTAGTNFDEEILNVEKMLIERGLTPSVFFRFPGLVSDQRLVKRLRELGLIPLGADAWLAKGEKPLPGSIILVHGNGNEPKGIALFRKLVEERKGKLVLLPLPLALTGDATVKLAHRPAEGR